MELTTKKNGTELTVLLNGELNTATAPELNALLNTELPATETLYLDFSGCDFVSSAGLRVLLAAFKTLKAKNGQMELQNVGPDFREVLGITGLDAVFGCE